MGNRDGGLHRGRKDRVPSTDDGKGSAKRGNSPPGGLQSGPDPSDDDPGTNPDWIFWLVVAVVVAIVLILLRHSALHEYLDQILDPALLTLYVLSGVVLLLCLAVAARLRHHKKSWAYDFREGISGFGFTVLGIVVGAQIGTLQDNRKAKEDVEIRIALAGHKTVEILYAKQVSITNHMSLILSAFVGDVPDVSTLHGVLLQGLHAESRQKERFDTDSLGLLYLRGHADVVHKLRVFESDYDDYFDLVQLRADLVRRYDPIRHYRDVAYPNGTKAALTSEQIHELIADKIGIDAMMELDVNGTKIVLLNKKLREMASDIFPKLRKALEQEAPHWFIWDATRVPAAG